MEFIDLKMQQQRIRSRIDERIASVLGHGHYIMGPEVRELEQELCRFTGAAFCVACASGSMALELALAAWAIRPGDAVLTTPFSFIATAEAIVRFGAIPVFVDIDPLTYNMNMDLLAEILASGSYKSGKHGRTERLRPRAVIAVDIFGNPADYDRLLEIAGKYKLQTLEDAAQSFGASYRGKKTCNCGCSAAATSFFPTKPLGCYGDGGAVFTDDPALAAVLDSLRYHGRANAANKYEHVRIGYNGRIDTLQAAILMAKLEIFEDEIELRGKVAARYDALLRDFAPNVQRPVITDGGKSSWAQFTVSLPEGVDRASVIRKMKDDGIPTAIHYPKGMHMQTCMQYLGNAAEDCPCAVHAAAHVLSLPMHPYLTEPEQEQVVAALARAIGVS